MFPYTPKFKLLFTNGLCISPFLPKLSPLAKTSDPFHKKITQFIPNWNI